MLKKILLILVIFCFCYAAAQQKSDESFEVIAKHIEYKDNIVIATGDVLMTSPTYYITAQKVIYDKSKNQVQLFDQVSILKNNKDLSISDYSFVEFEVESSSKFVFMIYENNLWIESATVESKGNDVYMKDSYMSSCDCSDPDWSIRFSSGSHYDDYSWLQTFNNRLYIKNIPVFYLPYFAFYTNTKRHSGLLTPTVGYSRGEGFTYIQPIYYAPADNWDLEVVPQHRARRGNGMYAYFRYADSPESMLKISTGYFKEEKQFQVKNKLKNQEHYGFGVDYERKNIFSTQDNEDGLYLKLDFLRDIDYKKLSDSEINDSTKKVESKINYFYKTSSDYIGTYLRYYRQVGDSSTKSKITQHQTIQKLPTLHHHRYATPILKDLLFSSDFNTTNYHRTKGLNAQETTLSLPFFYGFSLFDNYLNISLQEELFFAYLKYDENNLNIKLNNGRYFQARHTITASTNLIKAYDNFIHTLNLGSTFYVPSNAKSNGDILALVEPSRATPTYKDKTYGSEKNLAFWLSQSFYHRDFATLFLNHKIRQSILYDGDGKSKLGNLENQIGFYHQYGSISNRFFYNHEDKKLIQSSTTLKLLYNNYFLNARHLWTKDTPNSNKQNTESIDYEVGFSFFKDYKLSYRENYNIYDKLLNIKEIKLSIDKGCWFFHTTFGDELVSAGTLNNKPIRQDVIYFYIELRPIGGIEQEYTRKKDNNE